MSPRRTLIEHIRNESMWRREDAVIRPEVEGNVEAARALAEAADFVARLPDEDERLRRLEALHQLQPGFVGIPASEVVSRFGGCRYDGATGSIVSFHSPRDLLKALLAACEREIEEGSAGRPGTRELPGAY